MLCSISLEDHDTGKLVLPPALMGSAGVAAVLELMMNLPQDYPTHAFETLAKYGAYEIVGRPHKGYRFKARLMRVDIPDDGREK